MASSSEPSSSGGSPSVDSYIGSLISLTSKSDIRYEGVLVSINPQDSTISLHNVKSYGTEGRRKDGPQIPSSDRVYEYILFRGSDIKDLQVKSSSSVPTKQQTHNDPAIIQSQYASAPTSHTPSASVGDGAGLRSKAVPQDLGRQQFPDTFSLHQTGSHMNSWASPTFTNVDGLMHSQGYSGTSSGQAHAQQQSDPFQPQTASLQNPLQYPEGYTSTSMPKFAQTAISLAFPSQSAFSSPPNSSSFLSNNASLASSLPSHVPVTPALASTNQELNSMSKAGPSQTSFLPVSSILFSSSSIMGSSSGPIITLPPLLTPDQLTKSASVPTSLDKLYPEPKDVGPLFSSSMNSSSAVSGMLQEPLLLLLTASQSQQFHAESGAVQFTEEFDFTAMNEKFNKDEVWGSLGKEKQRPTMGDRIVADPIHYNVEVNEGYVQDPPNARSKPVYNRDDFFDTLSCNSLNRGWTGRTRLSERMKLDTETFGEFQQRPPMGQGNYGAPRSGYYGGSYNRGRGNGYYGGRGPGGYRPF